MELVLFSGNSNQGLAQKISSYLDIPLGQALVSKFSDGETRVELHDNVRGRDVFIIQSTCAPTNQNIMEAVIMADACRRASAGRVTLVVPYYGYGRQERKSAPRTPITAKLVADLIEASGVERVLTMELHTAAIQGFFNIPVDHLYAKPVFVPYFQNRAGFGSDELMVVSPDAGGVERARGMAKVLQAPMAIADKRRDRPNESAVMNIIGSVEGKNCLLIDDMCDTAGSLTKTANALFAEGAKGVYAAISHPVFSGPAIERIQESKINEIICTDSIPLSSAARACGKIKIASIGVLLGKAIRRIHQSESVSSLFL